MTTMAAALSSGAVLAVAETSTSAAACCERRGVTRPLGSDSGRNAFLGDASALASSVRAKQMFALPRRASVPRSVMEASAPSLAIPRPAPGKGLQAGGVETADRTRPLRVLIAGGGIGGLVLALAAKKSGMDVTVFERDLSAIRGEGQYRGPIQIQSNALAALEAVDVDMANEIMANGTVTGDRINGLVDGLTGDWYVKFDTWKPAVERGLPITRVISRMTLQQILAKYVGEDLIQNGCNVVDFEEYDDKVIALLEDGRRVEGDLLIGADGIRSKVRRKLFGECEPTYSDYTCYTGIADFVPPDIETVGYRVFLGNKQYFVSSDVGHGKMQWYAFHNEPAGGTDGEGKRGERLMKLFGHWCDGVVDLIQATPEEMILRRDIYDRIPIMNWTRGRVALLGDSAHAMQPNMGQGGCMAIEDAHQLAVDLKHAMDEAAGKAIDVPTVLTKYQMERRMRVGAVHGLARMAAVMASTYKAYLGEGLGPLEGLTKLKIPHPGKVGGRIAMTPTMPMMLEWVLGGNEEALEGRVPYCSLDDRARNDFSKLLVDDDALERATKAEWVLVPSGSSSADAEEQHKVLRVCCMEGRGAIVGSEAGSHAEVNSVVLEAPSVSAQHVRFHVDAGACFATDLGSTQGTIVNGTKLAANSPRRVRPGDTILLGKESFRLKQRKTLEQVLAKRSS